MSKLTLTIEEMSALADTVDRYRWQETNRLELGYILANLHKALTDAGVVRLMSGHWQYSDSLKLIFVDLGVEETKALLDLLPGVVRAGRNAGRVMKILRTMTYEDVDMAPSGDEKG